ncbi:flagella basal body P-ring formation protein FlgA [Aliiroseovarius sediminilitoris]|uniref:Flagella basal body P-ring formation protein FlgA n=1 Tax=Aliiroseovarius sediminilitoris TaxID=1173584 RepID=A0A1I0MVE3_9RHOB|nr:flagellar basal body P-ring formation chaperone FlgA [Aliiroseovarius sediminilitoris]SEV92741.1 flagella basal body P-ring formation protein FlgA [Aliiroseovarius sediminilitoris]
MRALIGLVMCVASAGLASADTVVAARNLRANAVITAQDVELIPSDLPGGFQFIEDVVGQEARVVLYAGRPVMVNDIGPPALVERNQIVTLAYVSGPLTILAEGRSLGRAGIGDRVRILNLSSRSTVTGSVLADGTVSVSHTR